MIKKRIYLLLFSLFVFVGYTAIAQNFNGTDSVATVMLNDSIAAARDYIPETSDDLIEDRLSCIQQKIKLSYNRTVRGFIDYFTIKNRRYALLMERRKNLYFPIFEEYLKKYNMPDELKYLSIVESGLNPRAVSRVGAAGLWQFMPVTGKEYKLYQDEFIDERLDPYKSTEAACRYLQNAYNMLGDWHLAIASYNCGLGNVRRAIRKSGYKDSFWEVYKHLPQETRAYVPQFIALTYVMNHLNEHNIQADSIEFPIQHDTIMVHRQYMNISSLCNQLGICPDEFAKLNPSIKKSIIPGKTSYVIRIPSDKTSNYTSNRVAIMDSCSRKYIVVDTTNINESIDMMQEAVKMIAKKESSPKTNKFVYVVKRGESLGKISGKFHVSTANIKKWNNIRSNTIKSGQRLTIYKNSKTVKTTAPSQEVAKAPVQMSVKKKHTHYYVQPGDTLWTICQKYDGISVAQIKKLNKLKGNSIKVGQKLILG